MRRIVLPFFFFFAGFLPLHAANHQVEMRKAVFTLVNAFANDGFKTRDYCHFDSLAQKQTKIIRVSLTAPNAYWMIASTTSPAKIALSVFDSEGKPVPGEFYSGAAVAAFGFHPAQNGVYFVRVEETTGKAADFCLTYAYK